VKQSDSVNSTRSAETRSASANEAHFIPDSDSSKPSLPAADIAADHEASSANGPESASESQRANAQLRNVTAAPVAQQRAIPASVDVAPQIAATPSIARSNTLAQSEGNAPLIPDTASEESAAADSGTEAAAGRMNLVSTIWFAIGQLPVVAAVEPVRSEGPALLQDLIYGDWEAVESAIDDMLAQIQTGITWVTPQNVRDAVFASSAAVLAAFAGEAALRRQQRLKDEELLALAFDADGHLALA
jgi:hypothetical protein